MSGKKRKYSFTMLNTFEICPWKFRYAYVEYKKEPSTPEMEEGNRVHKDFEDMFAKRKEPTPFVQQYIDALEPIRAPCATYTEKSLGMREDDGETSYGAADVFYRAKLDLLILPPAKGNDHTAYNIDWKTGNPNYPKMNQLNWSNLLVFANFPWVNRIGSRLAFIGAKGKRIYPEDSWNVTRREDIPAIKESLMEAVEDVRRADTLGLYPKKESALCRYCAVEDCEHHGR